MTRTITLLILSFLLLNIPVIAAEKLVLDLDMDTDLLSLSHHIDGFLFTPTMNFSSDLAGNLSGRIKTDTLKNHLAATALVRINGAVAGIATEQEIVSVDPDSGKKIAESAWLITLNYPGATGFLAVKQQEDATKVFNLVAQVMQNPQGKWEDKSQRILSTSNSPSVQLAAGDLSIYQGGRFEEYNYLNMADLKNHGRFRARIQFVIYPAK